MGDTTAISWTDATFNPWIGCARVSPGCLHCYAEARDKRVGDHLWGKDAPRRRTTEANWRKPLAWNRNAAERGTPTLVFCASLADVFEDRPDLTPWRADLFDLIERTPHLIWQLLTKRPENVEQLLPLGWMSGTWPETEWHGPPNVWIGTTVEDQQRAEERLPWLLSIPAPVRFVSVEPLLGPLDLTAIDLLRSTRESDPSDHWPRCHLNALTGHVVGPDDVWPHSIDWVIVGGESGPGFRAMDVDYARRVVAQCEGLVDVDEWGVNERLPVPVWFKQHGGLRPTSGGDLLDGRLIHQMPPTAQR